MLDVRDGGFHCGVLLRKLPQVGSLLHGRGGSCSQLLHDQQLASSYCHRAVQDCLGPARLQGKSFKKGPQRCSTVRENVSASAYGHSGCEQGQWWSRQQSSTWGTESASSASSYSCETSTSSTCSRRSFSGQSCVRSHTLSLCFCMQ